MAKDENTFLFDTKPFTDGLKKIADGMTDLPRSAERMANKINKQIDKLKLQKKLNKPIKQSSKDTEKAKEKNESFGKGLSNLVGKLGLIAIAYKSIQKILQNMPEIGQALGIVKDVFFKNFLFPLRKLVFPLLQRLVDWVRDNRVQFIKWGQILANVFKVIGNQIKFVIDLGKKIVRTFAGFFENTFGISIKNMTELMNILSFKFAVVMTFIQSLLTKTLGSIGKFFEGFSEGFKFMKIDSTIMDDITSTFSEFMILLKDLEPLLKPIGKLVGQIFGATLKLAIATISLGFKGIEQTIGSIVDLIKLVKGEISGKEFGELFKASGTKLFGAQAEALPDIKENSVFGKLLNKLVAPDLAQPIKRERKVKDAIIKKDGTIINTSPDDNLIATKNDVRLQPSNATGKGVALGGIKVDFSGMQIILPQATVEKAKEIGKNIVDTITEAIQTELNALGEY